MNRHTCSSGKDQPTYSSVTAGVTKTLDYFCKFDNLTVVKLLLSI